MPHIAMHHAVDPRDALLKRLGDFSDVEIFNNQILLAVYVRPEITAGGIALHPEYVKEDEVQSKVGLIIAMGNDAGDDPTGKWFRGIKRKLVVGDWIIFRPTDAWAITVNKVMCRVIDDNLVRGRTAHPDTVY